ncbi:hypothetical protein GCM10027589_15120 [Actinocorallia lasiicapitis]
MFDRNTKERGSDTAGTYTENWDFTLYEDVSLARPESENGA